MFVNMMEVKKQDMKKTKTKQDDVMETHDCVFCLIT